MSGAGGRTYSSPAHEEAYVREFGDRDALEYLDLIREVVQGQDAEKDAATRAFLLTEFAAYSRKTAGVPGDFQAILDVFAKWCAACEEAGGERGLVREAAHLNGDIKVLLDQLKQI